MRRESSTLYVDGSITASHIASRSPLTVGVIKSHRTLYADGDAFRVLVGLETGERSSVFRVSPQKRNAVASWYVRVRNPRGHDALFGLVRVESAESADITTRANEISRWVIAEGSPLALPDGRWDKMSYGIRDTEEFLQGDLVTEPSDESLPPSGARTRLTNSTSGLRSSPRLESARSYAWMARPP